MRLGILGPARGDLHALARAAQGLVDELGVERVIYVGDDDAMDDIVATWARGIVGGDPGDETLFLRAAKACANADAETINRFVDAERARARLQLFSSVPADNARTIELMDGRVVLFVFDKAALDEEDIIGATILVYGKADAPLLRRVGVRTFVAPGPIGCAEGGRVVLDDEQGGVSIEVVNGAGEVTSTEHVGAPSGGGRIRVQGE